MRRPVPGFAISPLPSMSKRHLPLLIALSALFAMLMGLAVLRDITLPLDQAVAEMFRSGPLAVSAPRWREGMRDLTALGSFMVLGLAVAASCAFLVASGRWRLALLVLVSTLSAALVSTGLKFLLARTRPDFGAPVVQTFTPSFPSGHAFLSTVVFLTIGGLLALAARRRREKGVIFVTAVFLALAIGASRVVLGVHWLTDVAAGWLFGLSWAGATLMTAHHLARREAEPGL